MKKISLILLVFFLLFQQDIYSQKNIEFEKKNFENDIANFNIALKNINTANIYLSENNLNQALNYYKKANDFNPENAKLNYLIGYCNLYLGKYTLALPFLEKSLLLCDTVAPDIFYLLGQCYHLTSDFQQAIAAYKKDISLFGNDTANPEYEKLRKLVAECENGEMLSNNKKNVKITNLTSLNSENDEYGLFKTSSKYYYTVRQYTKVDKNRNEEPFLNEDVFISDNIFASNFKNAGIVVNSDKNDAVAGISNDERQIFIYKDVNGGDIFYSYIDTSGISAPVPFPYPVNTEFYENSVSLSADGTLIYFVSDRDTGNFGLSDIYYSLKDANGKWSEPVNLGSAINTPYNETCVFVTHDGNTLYFSSDGHNTIGGYDVFVSRKINGAWSKAENLGIPINSPDEDAFFHKFDSVYFFSSGREGGLGANDIYMLVYLPDEKKDTSDVLITQIDTVVIDFNKYVPAKKYTVIRNFNFEYNKYENFSAIPVLDTLAAYMNRFPEAKIEIVGYTDTYGKNEYNLKLSAKRSAFAKNYLINKGVKPENIIQSAKGEENQLSLNTDKKGYVLWNSLPYNRRVEFIVHNQGKEPLLVEQIKVPVEYQIKSSIMAYCFSVLLETSASPDLLKSKYSSLSNVNVDFIDGLYVYSSGCFGYADEAEKEKERLLKSGFEKCFVFIRDVKK